MSSRERKTHQWTTMSAMGWVKLVCRIGEVATGRYILARGQALPTCARCRRILRSRRKQKERRK